VLASILNPETPIFTAFAAHFLMRGEQLAPFPEISSVLKVVVPSPCRKILRMPLASLAILAAALSYGVARIYERRSRAMGIAPVAAATDEVAALRLIPVLVAPIADTSWASSALAILAILARRQFRQRLSTFFIFAFCRARIRRIQRW
jgi:hypothetical protein